MCGAAVPSERLLKSLEALYKRYNRRSFVGDDPVRFLYPYKELGDREIAALVASSLAFGNLKQIRRSVAAVLDQMGPSPAGYLERASRKRLRTDFGEFRHRFASGEDLCALLFGTKRAIETQGSLRACFMRGFNVEGGTVIPALADFVETLKREAGISRSYLLPAPGDGSACKRLHLFLRWMVRRDEVDPGGWEEVPPSGLVVPVDTHIHRISLALGFTERKSADGRTAEEVTDAFRKLAPEDPVRYDFALTRLGIREDTDLASFLKRCGVR